MSDIDDEPQSTETEKRLAIGMTPIFQCLGRDELQGLIVLATARTYDAGEIIITDGEAGEHIFVISTGAAAVFKNGAHISYVRKGNIVGEMALITGRPRSATVIMVERGDVLRLVGPRGIRGTRRAASRDVAGTMLSDCCATL